MTGGQFIRNKILVPTLETLNMRKTERRKTGKQTKLRIVHDSLLTWVQLGGKTKALKHVFNSPPQPLVKPRQW